MPAHATPMRGPCEAADEEAVFRSRCGAQIDQWTQQRQRWPVLVLIVSSPPGLGGNTLGTGQLMAAALRFHVTCMRLKRACYLSVYHSRIHQYFGYADGSNWDAGEFLRLHNASEFVNLSLSLSLAQRAHNPYYIETTLYKKLRNETAPLLLVRLAGIFATRAAVSFKPREEHTLFNSPAAAQALFRVDDPCYLRFVTQPRFRAALPRAPIVMHLRTGYADVDTRLAMELKPNRSSTAAWMEAACGSAPFATRQKRVALSDSPGVLRWLLEQHGVASGSTARMNHTITRTWGVKSKWMRNTLGKSYLLDAEFAAFDDVVVAGMATTLQTAPQGLAIAPGYLHGTTFTLPALARSVCIQTAQLALPDCPHWPSVFLRDFRKAIGFRDTPAKTCKKHQPPDCNGHGRFARVQDLASFDSPTSTSPHAVYTSLRARTMASKHPCKNEPNVAACYLWQIEALK